jgi:hypothetical protein
LRWGSGCRGEVVGNGEEDEGLVLRKMELRWRRLFCFAILSWRGFIFADLDLGSFSLFAGFVVSA